MTMKTDARAEPLTREIGQELLDRRTPTPGLFSMKYYSDKLMSKVMENQPLKDQLFRFVDLFPMLQSPGATQEFLNEYLSQPGVKLPAAMQLALAAGSVSKTLLYHVLANRIESMAAQFIVGASPRGGAKTLRRNWNSNVGYTVDLLGETCITEEEADGYRARYVELIETLCDESNQWPEQPLLENDHIGPIPRNNISIKITSLCPKCDPCDLEGTLDRCEEALRPILELAARRNVTICFDMEDSPLKDLTLTLFERCCESIDFPASIAIQSYLKSVDDDARRLVTWSRKTGRQVVVRLIKGAYWDQEIRRRESPVWPVKRMTDASFERTATYFAEQMPRDAGTGGVKLAIGTHNIRSIAWTYAQIRRCDLPVSAFEVQKLYGMGDAYRTAMIDRGIRLREYSPIGEMIAGMAYFVRRLLENTSNESWLHMEGTTEVPDEQLLASPHDIPPDEVVPDFHSQQDSTGFVQELPHNFADPHQRNVLAQALAAAPKDSPPEVTSDTELKQVIKLAGKHVAHWNKTPREERAAILGRTADLISQRRDELSAMLVSHEGATWRESDAEVCRAVNECRLLAGAEPNKETALPPGIMGVITPWSSPLGEAIGLAATALAGGNAVLLKPSRRMGAIGRAIGEILHSSGVPKEIFSVVYGTADQVGRQMVADPDIAGIAIAGSRATIAQVRSEALDAVGIDGHAKRIVGLSGGKSTIIIDESAETTKAVLATRDSAFASAGQCRVACGRVIVVGSIYKTFVQRLIGATRTLTVGDPRMPGTNVGPIIDEASAGHLRDIIGLASTQYELFKGTPPARKCTPDGRPLIEPHIFVDILHDSELVRKEIYGPVLPIVRVATFDEALQLANDIATSTAVSLFSRKPSHHERALEKIHIADVCLNRHCSR